MRNRKNILIVDDEQSFANILAEGLSAHDQELKAITAENGKVAVGILESTKVDVVLTDLKMPEMDGFGLLAYLNRNHRDIPVIVITAFSTPEIEKSLNNLGIHQYLEKPLDFNTLVENVYTALSNGKEGFIKGVSLATFLQLMVGGTIPSRTARIDAAASTAPAAPRRCPVMDFVALIWS